MKDIFVFDLDGTLIDTKKVTSQVLDDMVLARGGSPKDFELTDAVLSHGVLEIVGDICKRYCGDPEDYLLEFRERIEKINVSRTLVYPGVRDLLEAAVAIDVRLAINTNKPTKLAIKTLEDTNLSSFFSVVQGSDNSLSKKPALDHMNIICRELACTYDQILFFGDSEVDQETAHNGGIDYVHFEFGYGDICKQFTTPVLKGGQISNEFINEVLAMTTFPKWDEKRFD